MPKTRITIEFDSEKVDAMRMYMPGKGLELETELEKFLASLYDKNVPTQVRDFIALKEEKAAKTVKKTVNSAAAKIRNEAVDGLDFVT